MKNTALLFASVLLGLAMAWPAASQDLARILSVVPDTAEVSIKRLGSTTAEPLAADALLQRWDRVETSEEEVIIEVECPVESGNIIYLSGDSGFAGILVPSKREETDAPSCWVNILTGDADMTCQAPTQINAGGVVMACEGTQYAVRVSRSPAGPMRELDVFDGEVYALWRGEPTPVNQGAKLIIDPTNTDLTGPEAVLPEPAPLELVDIGRSARVYARLSVARAKRKNAPVENEALLLERFNSLQMQVLTNPDDTEARVDLAKELIRYKSNDQAVFHLNRADLLEADRLREVGIEPEDLQEGVSLKNLDLLEARNVIGAVEPTDRYLRMIEVGGVREDRAAVAGLAELVSDGQATARDYYALAKGYLDLNDAAQSKTYAERALALHQQEQRTGRSTLSAEALEDLRAILSRATQLEGRVGAVEPTDRLLELIEVGEARGVQASVATLERRVESGQAMARDYYALAKAYLVLDDTEKSKTYGNRALNLHQQGLSRLSAEALADLRALLSRFR